VAASPPPLAGVVADASAPPLTARIQLQHGYENRQGSAISSTELFATHGADSLISIWDVPSGALLRVVASPLDRATTVRWNLADDRLYVTGARAASARGARPEASVMLDPLPRSIDASHELG
jgi:hypothetical protein